MWLRLYSPVLQSLEAKTLYLSAIYDRLLQILILNAKPWQDACQQFANSVSSLSPDDAERVGRDPGGSRVLEALVAGAASGKQKGRLLRALHGRWAVLAGEFGSSHLVEKCFAAAVRPFRAFASPQVHASADALCAISVGTYSRDSHQPFSTHQ